MVEALCAAINKGRRIWHRTPWRRRPEFRIIIGFWTPACAGVTRPGKLRRNGASRCPELPTGAHPNGQPALTPTSFQRRLESSITRCFRTPACIGGTRPGDFPRAHDAWLSGLLWRKRPDLSHHGRPAIALWRRGLRLDIPIRYCHSRRYQWKHGPQPPP
jgi:hypothetical protein